MSRSAAFPPLLAITLLILVLSKARAGEFEEHLFGHASTWTGVDYLRAKEVLAESEGMDGFLRGQLGSPDPGRRVLAWVILNEAEIEQWHERMLADGRSELALKWTVRARSFFHVRRPTGSELWTETEVAEEFERNRVSIATPLCSAQDPVPDEVLIDILRGASTELLVSDDASWQDWQDFRAPGKYHQVERKRELGFIALALFSERPSAAVSDTLTRIGVISSYTRSADLVLQGFLGLGSDLVPILTQALQSVDPRFPLPPRHAVAFAALARLVDRESLPVLIGLLPLLTQHPLFLQSEICVGFGRFPKSQELADFVTSWYIGSNGGKPEIGGNPLPAEVLAYFDTELIRNSLDRLAAPDGVTTERIRVRIRESLNDEDRVVGPLPGRGQMAPPRSLTQIAEGSDPKARQLLDRVIGWGIGKAHVPNSQRIPGAGPYRPALARRLAEAIHTYFKGVAEGDPAVLVPMLEATAASSDPTEWAAQRDLCHLLIGRFAQPESYPALIKTLELEAASPGAEEQLRNRATLDSHENLERAIGYFGKFALEDIDKRLEEADLPFVLAQRLEIARLFALIEVDGEDQIAAAIERIDPASPCPSDNYYLRAAREVPTLATAIALFKHNERMQLAAGVMAKADVLKKDRKSFEDLLEFLIARDDTVLQDNGHPKWNPPRETLIRVFLVTAKEEGRLIELLEEQISRCEDRERLLALCKVAERAHFVYSWTYLREGRYIWQRGEDESLRSSTSWGPFPLSSHKKIQTEIEATLIPALEAKLLQPGEAATDEILRLVKQTQPDPRYPQSPGGDQYPWLTPFDRIASARSYALKLKQQFDREALDGKTTDWMKVGGAKNWRRAIAGNLEKRIKFEKAGAESLSREERAAYRQLIAEDFVVGTGLAALFDFREWWEHRE